MTVNTSSWPRRFVALLSLMLVLVAACAGSEDSIASESFDDSGSSNSPPTTFAPSEAPGQGSGGFDAIDGDVGRPAFEEAAFQVTAAVRQVVFTAELTVAVTDVGAAAKTAVAAVEGIGGFVFGEQTVALPQPRSVVIFKVDPDRFQDALTLLGAIGEVRSQNIRADDVTERVVDLQSRISTSEASVDRLRALIADAVDVKTLVEIESQLLVRETELETLRGQLRTIEGAVALATISVTFTEALANPSFALAVTGYRSNDDQGDSCPGQSGITIDEGDDVTVCFELTNNGDTSLTGFELDDAVLDVDLADLVVVFGDPNGTIEPGQSILLAAEISVDRRIRTQTRVTAVPINADGALLEARSVSRTESFFVDAVDPGGLPGFGDTLSAAWHALATGAWAVVLVVTALIPFLWIPLLAWLAWRWWTRRRSSEETPMAETSLPNAATAADAPSGTDGTHEAGGTDS